ncbi:ATP-binding cassette domain-containing protein [Mesorhizobium sp. WSM4887]|uniref:ATP-binding cassette domain-containing protein n=2 Tax=Mesorhizobium TaxID=68287 RepID=UPI00241689BE|nr:ATP-binding cassette domain-containing protein [Mesorhizobium sp. WSM4887]
MGHVNRFGVSQFSSDSASSLLALAILAVIAALAIVIPGFLSVGNLLTIGQQTAVIAICAFPMTALIIARGIDLSIGANLALSGIVAALTLHATQSGAASILAALLCGSALGAANGFFVGFARVAPFMATLATMAMMRGATLVLSGADSIPVANQALIWPGSSIIFGVPTPLAMALLAAVAWSLFMSRTLLGRWIFAVGGNQNAAAASLVPVRRVHLVVYLLAGLSAGICAVVTIGRLGSGQPLAGMGLEFDAITAAMIGGASLAGGQGAMFPTLLGATLLGVISAGLSFLQVPLEATYIVKAALLLASALLTTETLSFPKILGWGQSTKASGQAPGLKRTLSVNGLSKSYGSFRALDNATLEIHGGRVLALVGENGAGKSTLVKCLTGIQRADSGSIALNGAEITVNGSRDARLAGITAIHQHFSLLPDLTIAENLFLGQPRTRYGFLARRDMNTRARSALKALGLDFDPETRLDQLNVGQRQLVEIAKALEAHAWVIIMDEPTSALSVRERDRLFSLVSDLKAKGCAIVYISHKLEEVFSLCDDVVILRDGEVVASGEISNFTPASLVEGMVGRKLENVFPHDEVQRGDLILSAQIAEAGLLQDVTVDLYAGEIVGVCGLMGSGRTELLRALAGLTPEAKGQITVSRKPIAFGDLRQAYQNGIVYLPEDRHAEGFVPQMTVADNLGLVWMTHGGGLVSPPRIRQLATKKIAELLIKPPRPEAKARELSGGNQQKVVLGKWLAGQPKVLLLDEPTNGVDVGAKSEIHRLISRYKSQGAAILLVSSELPEVLGVSDRILVMSNGRIAAELPRGCSENEVMSIAFQLGGAST